MFANTVEPKAFCGRCQATVPRNAEVCGYCGGDFTAPVEVSRKKEISNSLLCLLFPIMFWSLLHKPSCPDKPCKHGGIGSMARFLGISVITFYLFAGFSGIDNDPYRFAVIVCSVVAWWGHPLITPVILINLFKSLRAPARTNGVVKVMPSNPTIFVPSGRSTALF